MDAVIARLLAWAVAHSGYPAPAQPPSVEYRPAAYFVEHVCDGRTQCAVQAVYLEETRTIIISSAVRDLPDLRTRSLIVHEIVHDLQQLSGRWRDKSCETWVEREHEAFRLQFQYFAAHGGNPFSHSMPVLDRMQCEQDAAAPTEPKPAR